jgi:hypothetical protein
MSDPMSEIPDPLEAELSSLLPHEPSPGLRRRIGERLADGSRVPFHRLWWLAVSSGLAAACVTAVLLWWWQGRGSVPKQAQQPTRPIAPVVEDTLPTLLAYERAFARSSEELDRLLDRQTVAAAEATPESEPIHAFTRSDEALRHLLGDD